jgi:hypothetical protein
MNATRSLKRHRANVKLPFFLCLRQQQLDLVNLVSLGGTTQEIIYVKGA